MTSHMSFLILVRPIDGRQDIQTDKFEPQSIIEIYHYIAMKNTRRIPHRTNHYVLDSNILGIKVLR